MPEISEFVLGMNPVIRQTEQPIDTATKPLARYLTLALNVPVRIVVESDYDALIHAMREREIDAALFGEYAFYIAQLEAGAEALAVSVLTGSDEAATYQSVIITRTDSPIHALEDLRGETVGFVDRSSTAGYLIPRRMLREAGLDPDTEITARFFTSHPAVAAAVRAGEVPVGALHSAQFARAATEDGTGRLRIIAMSPPIPKGPFAVRRGLDREVRQRLLQALLAIHNDAPDAAQLILSPGTHWRPTSNRHVTLKTVAALSGVSYGTVSRVINGRAHVAPETQARVMSIVQDLGYRPNAAAVSLIANRSDLIGFVAPDLDDPIVAQYMVGLQRTLDEAGMQAVLCPVAHDRDREADVLALLDDGRFGGLVLTAWSRETPAVSTLAAAGRALVIIGVTAASAPIAAVAPSDDALVAAAVSHLRAEGHTAIAAIVAVGLHRTIERALAAASDDPSHVSDVIGDAVTQGRDLTRALLRDATWRPTAIICGSEQIAMGALQAAAAVGVAVPEALSIVALNESWLAAATTPTLTTIASDPAVLGEQAAQLLIEQIRGGERIVERQALPPPVVTRRASSGPRT